MNDVNLESLNSIQGRLKNVAKELLHFWNERQKKTPLDEMTVKVLGQIHDNSEPLEYYQTTLDILKNLINALPSSQRETIDANSCHEGFMRWNDFWKKFASKYEETLPIKVVHLAYESWVKETKGKFHEFMDLWQFCMIKGTSEACCETVGSIMNIHVGRNRYLKPDNFSKEIVLRYNLGPMHVLDNPKSSYNFVQDVYNRSKMEFVRRTERPDKISTKNLIKSSAISTFEKRSEEKSHFPSSFWEN